MPALWRPRFDPVFVRRFEERLDEADQERVQHIINLLCIDPLVDAEGVKVVISTEAGGLWTYDDGEVWVSYKITGTDEFYLLSCGRHGRMPAWGRRL